MNHLVNKITNNFSTSTFLFHKELTKKKSSMLYNTTIIFFNDEYKNSELKLLQPGLTSNQDLTDGKWRKLHAYDHYITIHDTSPLVNL